MLNSTDWVDNLDRKENKWLGFAKPDSDAVMHEGT